MDILPIPFGGKKRKHLLGWGCTIQIEMETMTDNNTAEANHVEWPSERYDRNDYYTVIALEDVLSVIEANESGEIQAQSGETTTWIDLSDTDQFEITESHGEIQFKRPESKSISKTIDDEFDEIIVRDAIVPAIDLEEDDAQ